MVTPDRKSVKCVVVTPEQTVLDVDVDSVALPVFDGALGVLPGRAPLVARLGPGELRLTKRDGSSERYFVDGGFAQVRRNVVTVLTPRAQESSSLDRAALDRQLADVNAQRPTTDADFDEKARQLLRVRAQRRLAGR
jgi:F-type H+-transporting ATPase subunit epsilon